MAGAFRRHVPMPQINGVGNIIGTESARCFGAGVLVRVAISVSSAIGGIWPIWSSND